MSDLVGRIDTVQRLRALLADVTRGAGRAVVVSGDPGVGKTAVLDAAVAECSTLGFRIARGEASELESRVPFAAISSCLAVGRTRRDPDVEEIRNLLRGGTSVAPVGTGAAQREYMIIERTLALIDDWCAEHPLAVLLDDTHWADSATLVVLARLARMIEQVPLFLLITMRELPRRTEVDALLYDVVKHGGTRLSLDPLSAAASRELVTKLTGGVPGPLLQRLVAGAAGNPLYIGELVAVLTRENRLKVMGGQAELTDAEIQHEIPRSLSGAIIRSLNVLSPQTRDTLQVAAVLTSSFTVTELASVLGRSVVELLTFVHEAVGAGVVVEAGQQLQFRHDMIRQALAEDLPRAAQLAIRLHAGRALAGADFPVERVAEYLLAGTDIDAETIEWVAREVDTLVLRAPDLAMKLLRRILGVANPGDPHAAPLQLKLARSLLWLGRPTEAEAAVRAVADGDLPAEDRCTLRWLLAQSTFAQGKLDQTVSEAAAALDQDFLTGSERARFLGLKSQCLLFLGSQETESAAELAIEIGTAAQDPYATAYGLYVLAAMRMFQEHIVEALELVDRALALLGDQYIQADLLMAPQLIRANCLMELDRIEEAAQILNAGIRRTERSGGAFLTSHYVTKSTLWFLNGRWDDALVEIETARDTPDYLGMSPLLEHCMGLISLHRGIIPVVGDEQPSRFDMLWVWLKSLTIEAAGEGDKALEVLFAAWEQGLGYQKQEYLHHVCPDLLRMAAVLGDQDRCRRVATGLATLATHQPAASIRGGVSLARGLAEHDVDLLLAAARAYQEAGRPLFQAYACEEAAVLLADAKDTTRARGPQTEAISIYSRLDATWDAARAQARLRHLGIHRGVRGPRKRPKTGWEALTETEVRVASLVAEGHSNPEIASRMYLSRSTVQTHVSSILGKLGLSSRVEVAIVAYQHIPHTSGAVGTPRPAPAGPKNATHRDRRY